MRTPTAERPHPTWSGTQKVYRFANGYGASVVRATSDTWGGTYGCERGLWELGVVAYPVPTDDPWHFKLTYNTPITDDVIGYLSETEVDELLARVEALPAYVPTPV